MIAIINQKSTKYKDFFQKSQVPVYLYWDKIKYKAPPDLQPENFWAAIKLWRKMQFSPSIIKTESEDIFTWIKLSHYDQILHELDLNTGGSLLAFTKDLNDTKKYQFISRGIMEEAIASSQLEGAATTRKKAKEFLREGRKPTNHAEHMILNNYKSMQLIENEYKNKEMSLELLYELHIRIAQNTIAQKDLGHFRSDFDEIIIHGDDNEILFKPPKMDFVEQEIKSLIAFANDKDDSSFIHPIIKAIILHFWLAYLHPFVDGNGRLARLLFYWYLLRKNYWAFAYLPISKIIKKAPSQYKMAYIYSEQDDFDLT
ncbi:Fic family protein, partial [Candidatus Margulisiibacteriota bacterium]